MKMLSCALFVLASVVSAQGANGIIEEKNYKICPEDTLEIKLNKRTIEVSRDTIIYDTIRVTDPSMDSIYVYVVNVYPSFVNEQERVLEQGGSFDWQGMTISKAGTYEKVYKSNENGCDSIYRINVRGRVEVHVTDTLCTGSTKKFGGQTLEKPGIYRDSLHFATYDSITILSLIGHEPDTTIKYARIPEGTQTLWNGKTYSEQGVYDTLLVNRFGCDSLSRLILTTYHVDTIDTVAIICPNTTLYWHGMTYGQTGHYEFSGTRENGDLAYYRMDLTVKVLQFTERTFSICDDETVTFNGKTYANAGEYDDYITCDTLCKITIIKHPTQLHLQTGVMDATHPYYWQYTQDGEEKTDTLLQPGIYEHTSHNEETGCNDIWRLVLTRDVTQYHFIESVTICESEDYEWRGRQGLNRQGIGQTTHYYDYLRSKSDQDSIYELILTVRPVLRTTRTIPFCESITWGGTTYTESHALIDTLQSVQYGCDSIVTTLLSKGIPFHHHDTATIIPGETLMWRGRTIRHDGLYEDRYLSVSGCDSIYSLGVGLKEDAPMTKTRTWRENICEGNYYEWNGKKYFNSGIFVDTIFVEGTQEVDSLHILILTVNPVYATRERITFHSFPGTYRGHVFWQPGEEYTFEYTSASGCDSTITVVAEYEISHFEESVTICPGESYIWDWDGLSYNESGRYVKTITDANGVDSVEHILNLTVRYIPDTYIKKTICKGGSYTFGDRTLTESGNYTYTFHDTGCDSVVHLSLNVLNSDTNTFVHHMDQGQSYVWNGTTYWETGTYFHYGTNRFGCDSINVLELTVNKVDTVETSLTICPDEIPFEWNTIVASQSGDYYKTVKQANGDYIYYHLNLTVREVVQTDTTFTMCGDASLSFNGKTYTEAGHYRDYLSCDTLVNIHIAKYPQQLHETNASLGGDHGYTWTYWEDGEEKTNTFNAAGTYEYESTNAETGCSELWRLILTKDETEYHFVETQTICEGEDYTWHGLSNLSSQGIGTTSHYFDNYKTRNGKDSIYELVLTVTPVERTVRTITFCGETTWKGVRYTSSAVVYDTIAIENGCYRIERVNLDLATPFYSHETKELPQGTVLHWHNQNITTDGTYYDYNTTANGCDSIYQIDVTIIPAAPETNQYAEELSTCEGDTIVWRGKDLWRSGTYVDTVWTAGKEKVDSIFTIKLTVWPAPKDTIYRHMYTCGSYGASIRYQGKDYYENDTIVNTFHTIHGCDSIVKVYLHFNTALFLSDTVEIADTELPYTWSYRLDGLTRDTVLTTAGTYNHSEPAEGTCSNREQLVLIVYPTYLFEKDTTICETDLPFYWVNGPQDHAGDALQHAIGQTKQYEYRYTTVNNTDSVYRLNLTIEAAPKRTEQIYVCEGYPQVINGKQYGAPGSEMNKIYYDTMRIPSAGNTCDSIIYLEIYVSSSKEHKQTVILHDGESINWGKYTNITTGGIFRDTTKNVGAAGCDSISILHVIKELGDERVICSNDTGADVHPDKRYPYSWEHPQLNGAAPRQLYTSGTYYDTVYDAQGYIENLYRMDLTIVNPYDTTVYVHGCMDKGAFWRDEIFYSDTTFVDRIEVTPYTPEAPCDSVFHVNIIMDTVYEFHFADTICEEHLPYILGRQDPDTLWAEGTYIHPDQTVCGCDSTIYLTLRIIPKLTKNDSTFVCEDQIMEHPVILGDTVTPWFDFRNGGMFHGTWKDKWHGVSYTTDTIVWNCDSSYYHHIIVRPRQDQPAVDTFYLCQGDSVQLLWPYKDTWFKEPGLYKDTINTNSAFTDEAHGMVHNDRDFLCDSIIHWLVLYADTLHEEKTVHIAKGDSLFFDHQWRYAAGDYDSIGYAIDTNSYGEHCKYVMTLHLFVDSTYYFRDTLSVCEFANKDTLYTWADGYQRVYSLPEKDSAFHVIDTLPTLLYRFDSIYDLYVDYHQKYFTQIYDTICEGESLRFDIHHRDNTLTQRFLSVKGVYYDTIPALNGCDSIIQLYLETRDSIPTTYISHTITDREIPYLWVHQWVEDGLPKDSTDTLRATGIYRFTMPNQHGCDSTIVLNFTVHQTHVFRDTIDVCSVPNKTFTHVWNTGREQQFTVPDKDSAIHYYDTLQTRIKNDSIYDLLVNYREVAITYLDSNLCYGDSMRFGLTRAHQPRFLSKTGVYNDTLVRTANGCDSIIVLRLNVFPRYLNYDTHRMSSADTPYVWIHKQGGVEIGRDSLYAEGEYVYHFTNGYGCDSIDSLSLRIHQAYLYRDTIQICSSETPYTWGDKKDIYTTGEYTQYFRTHDNQADSTHVRYIKVMPVEYDTIQASICEGDSLRFGLTKANKPRFLYDAGLYNDTLTTIHGCDSIITLSLNIYPRHFHDTTVHIADVDTPYVWKHFGTGGTPILPNDSLYANGRYGFTYPSQYGCDSIDSLTLVVHPTYLFKDTITICTSETPYTWYNVDANGDSTLFQKAIYETGQYIKNLQTHDGYDSTYMRYIHVLPVIRKEIHDSICAGENNFYVFNGQRLTESGVFIDTLTAANGCDSIVTLNLTVNKPYYSFREEHIVEGQSVTVMGLTFDKDTIHTIKGLTPNGCDSTTVIKVVVHPMIDTIVTVCSNDLPYIWVNKWNGQQTPLYAAGIYRNDTTFVNGARMFYGLQLVVNNPVFKDIHDSICAGDNNFYTFKGMNLTESGIYRDTTMGANGCDSITTLHLTVNKPYYNYREEHIVEGQSATVMGLTFDKDTIHTIKGLTPNGCDSTTVIKVVVHPMVDTIVTVCSNDLPYIWVNKWNGQQTPLYAAGIYRNDTTFVNGARMFYGLQLVVNNPVFKDIHDSICAGDNNFYTFKGMNLTESGIYRDTTMGANGCDSITTLHLTVNKPYYNYREEHIVEGQSVTVMGLTFDKDTIHTIKGLTPNGCDSTTVIKVVVHPMIDTIVTVCSNDLPYIWVNKWNGQQTPLYAAGIYRNDTTFVNGARMFYGLQLRVNDPVFDTVRVAICEGSSYLFGGEHLTVAGVYRDTLSAANGCDSIQTLVLTVNKPYYNYKVEHILEGQSVDFFGTTYSTTGMYTHYGHTPEECDSTSVLQLIVHPMVDTIVTVCTSDLPYNWINKWDGSSTLLYTAGIYRNDTTVVNGERMFYGLELRVNDPVFDTVRVAICEGSSYLFGGEHLTVAGVYRDTLSAANGCDSIQTLVLTVNKPYYNYKVEHILEGQSVDFFGTTYSTTGMYTHYGHTPEECDSTSVLQLIVHPMVDTIVTVCTSDLPYNWINKWDGSSTLLYTAGIYRNDTTVVNGERMFYGLQLKVTQPTDTTLYREICEGDIFNFNNRFLTTSGEYRDTIKNTVGCDSIVILHLNVLKKYYNTINRTIYEGDTVMFHGDTISEPGNYPVRLSSSFGCDSIIELHLTVKRMYDDSVTVCANELPLEWRNRKIYESGIYRDTTYADGQEVVIGLKVNVLPIARPSEPIVATICEGDFYKFGDLILTTQGTYYDTLTAANGCDSIVMLSLQVIPVAYQSEIRRIFEGDSVFFDGKWLKESGVYERRETNGKCTDTYQLILTVLKEFRVDTTAYVCKNNLPFIWHGYEYNESGDYVLPTAWTDSSRVVTTLHLNVREAFYDERSISLCEGNMFIFRKDTFTSNAIFYDTIPSSAGCDSVIKYTVSVHPTFERWDTVHISDKDSYNFNGRQLTIPGDYEYTGRTGKPYECDSSIFLHLEVHPSYIFTEYRDVCAPDTIHWHGQTIHMDTVYQETNTTTRYGKDITYTYRDPYLTRYGFDSIYELKLTVHPSYFTYEQYLIREGETQTLHGINITRTDTIYTDTLHTIYGCDSIFQIAVNSKRVITVQRKDSICNGESYNFYGKTLTKAGTYRASVEVPGKMDSVIILTLKVNPTSFTKVTKVITEEDLPFVYDGRVYGVNDGLARGVIKDFTEEYINQYGCDSTIILTINVTEHYSAWNLIPICTGELLIIDGDTIRQPGQYVFLRRRQIDDRTSALDSLYRVEVYSAPSFEMPVKDTTICDGDYVDFAGKRFTKTGLHKVTLKTVNGCDSILTLNLHVDPAYQFDFYERVWPEELPFVWEGREYYNSGVFNASWQKGRCDSIRTLHLTVVKTDTITTNITVCEGEYYVWGEDTLRRSGTYSELAVDSINKISTLYVLNLIFSGNIEVLSAYSDEVCADDYGFDLHYTYSGNKRPSRYSIYFDSNAKTYGGFTDILNQPVLSDEVIHVAYDSKADRRPDIYRMRLVLDNGACGQGYRDNIELVVKYPSWVLKQNWDDVVAPLNKANNGGYDIVTAKWYVVRNGVSSYHGEAPYLHYDNLQPGDFVYMEAMRRNEGYYVPSCPIEIVQYSNDIQPMVRVSSYTSRHKPEIAITANCEGSYEIYSSTGLFISSGEFVEGNTLLALPNINGIYFVRTHVGDKTETHKVIIL